MILNNNSNFQFVVSEPLKKNNLSVFFLSTEKKKAKLLATGSFIYTERGKHEYALAKGASRALLVVSVPLLAEC